jgi:hypothetical protein
MLPAFTFPTSARYWFSRIVPLLCISLVMAVCALLLFIPHIYAADLSQVPYGVFSLTPDGKPVDSKILTNQLVAGVSIRWLWQSVEKSEGAYDWSYLDQQIPLVENSRKKLSLTVISGGKNTPSWVFSAGVQTFSFVDTNSYSPTYNQTVTIPVFWDSIFLQKKKNLIAKMGQHFSNNRDIVLVNVHCANATTDDWQVPSSKTDVQNWQAIGYTSDKLINACKQLIDATMSAFPNQVVTIPVARSSNNLDPDPDYVARNVVAYAMTAYPGRFIVQKNSLSADTPDPSVMPVLGAWQIIYDNQPAVVGQMLWAVTNDSTCRMNGKVKPCDPATVLQEAVELGAEYGMRYEEIYQKDILNSALAGVISYAADILTP